MEREAGTSGEEDELTIGRCSDLFTTKVEIQA
jgi:hypothetical protein